MPEKPKSERIKKTRNNLEAHKTKASEIYKIDFTVKDTNDIAKIILSEYWSTLKEMHSSNLREDDFRKESHDGRIDQEDKNVLNEKKVARALFNISQSLNITFPFGKIIDYETPLKKRLKEGHEGDIDLIGERDNSLFLIELKRWDSDESLLRAVLEIFTYTKLVSKVREKFVSNFKGGSNTCIVPTVLVFNNTSPARQLKDVAHGKLPDLLKLIKTINNHLEEIRINEIKFFLTSLEIKIHDREINGNFYPFFQFESIIQKDFADLVSGIDI